MPQRAQFKTASDANPNLKQIISLFAMPKSIPKYVQPVLPQDPQGLCEATQMSPGLITWKPIGGQGGIIRETWDHVKITPPLLWISPNYHGRNPIVNYNPNNPK
jgi:hypothetical protein